MSGIVQKRITFNKTAPRYPVGTRVLTTHYHGEVQLGEYHETFDGDDYYWRLGYEAANMIVRPIEVAKVLP